MEVLAGIENKYALVAFLVLQLVTLVKARLDVTKAKGEAIGEAEKIKADRESTAHRRDTEYAILEQRVKSLEHQHTGLYKNLDTLTAMMYGVREDLAFIKGKMVKHGKSE